MKSTIAKKTEGYGYRYTELADINKYCEDNDIRYYQEVETNEINQKDYIITYILGGEGEYTKHRGCQIVEARLSGINNPVQAYGSSLTYCRRYSLLMAFGLATEDDDAQSLSELKEPTKEDAEKYVISFGKHKGKKLNEVPEDYLEWLRDNDKTEPYLKKCCILLTEPLPNENEQLKIIKLMARVNELALDTNTNLDDITNHYEVESTSKMTLKQLEDCVKNLEEKKRRM